MPEKKIRIAVFAEGDEASKAKKNGADIVGSDDLIELIKKGDIKFDKCISTPEMMVKGECCRPNFRTKRNDA